LGFQKYWLDSWLRQYVQTGSGSHVASYK